MGEGVLCVKGCCMGRGVVCEGMFVKGCVCVCRRGRGSFVCVCVGWAGGGGVVCVRMSEGGGKGDVCVGEGGLGGRSYWAGGGGGGGGCLGTFTNLMSDYRSIILHGGRAHYPLSALFPRQTFGKPYLVQFQIIISIKYYSFFVLTLKKCIIWDIF